MRAWRPQTCRRMWPPSWAAARARSWATSAAGRPLRAPDQAPAGQLPGAVVWANLGSELAVRRSGVSSLGALHVCGGKLLSRHMRATPGQARVCGFGARLVYS